MSQSHRSGKTHFWSWKRAQIESCDLNVVDMLVATRRSICFEFFIDCKSAGIFSGTTISGLLQVRMVLKEISQMTSGQQQGLRRSIMSSIHSLKVCLRTPIGLLIESVTTYKDLFLHLLSYLCLYLLYVGVLQKAKTKMTRANWSEEMQSEDSAAVWGR